MRYIFHYYNSSPFGLSSFYTLVELKADNYETALKKVKKLVAPETEVDLYLLLEDDNPFTIPQQHPLNEKINE